jgi:hypothetical protein
MFTQMKTADIQAGDVVKIRKEFDGDDQLHMVVEWNEDRGFVIPINWQNGGIVPRELVRQEMIEPHNQMDDAEYLYVLERLGFGRIGTGGGCDALSKTLPDGREVLITADGDPSVPLASEQAQISIDDESETDLNAREVIRRAFALAQQ